MSNSIKSVVLVSPGWPPEKTPSGIATYVKNIADGLAVHGVASRVFSISPIDPACRQSNVVDLSEIARANRTMASRLGDRVRTWVGADPGGAHHVGRAITSTLGMEPRSQLVEVEESYGIARWIRARNIPCVVRLHGPCFINGHLFGMDPDSHEFRHKCESEFLGIRCAAGVTAPSRVVMEQTLAQLPSLPQLTAVIPNPVAMSAPKSRWTMNGCSARKILYVGQFARIKGSDVLLAAFSRVIEKAPDAELVFIGPDRGFRDDAGRLWEMEEYLQSNLAPHVRTRIQFLGAQPREIIDELRLRCGVAVVASRHESFSLALAESLAAGTPTVASAVGGMLEILEDGRSGLLFRSEDPDQLAAHILRIFENPQLAESLSAAGMVAAKRFNPVEVAKQTLEFYQEVMRHTVKQRF
jgi:glycosyltransferase involved in cell wall biosynthesis